MDLFIVSYNTYNLRYVWFTYEYGVILYSLFWHKLYTLIIFRSIVYSCEMISRYFYLILINALIYSVIYWYNCITLYCFMILQLIGIQYIHFFFFYLFISIKTFSYLYYIICLCCINSSSCIIR